MTYIPVACGIIEKEGMILAAKRGPDMSHPGKWEFPGGKQEAGETLEQCLKRELWEELKIEVSILSAQSSVTYDYGGKKIELFPFHALWKKGVPQLTEHERVAWMEREELESLDWAEADALIVGTFLQNQFSP